MLKTTFCAKCGKFYDDSLPECPVCARRRAEAQAQGGTAPKPFAKNRKMTMADRMRAAVPSADKEDATIQLNPEEIAAAAEAAKFQAAASSSADQNDLPTYEEESPSSGGKLTKVIGVAVGVVAALLLLVFSVGLMSGKTPAKPQQPTNQAVSSTTEPSKEEKPSQQQAKPEATPEAQQPTEPDQPQEPVEPEQPVEPTEPEEPVEPEEPEQPEEPSEPSEPEQPIEPQQPEQPEEPSEPSEPEHTAEPEQTQLPYESEAPENRQSTDIDTESVAELELTAA
ncbi:MAG: hypothetical protein MJ077_04490 [Oscillospiraceae bacterium]|nr:hypothetical protein [Oscillospiraceae bacterium]